jgi:hypothetical protein
MNTSSQRQQRNPICELFTSLSNIEGLELFEQIRKNGQEHPNRTPLLISTLNMTRKQFYTRIFALRNAGVITRKNGEYFITSLGKVVAFVLDLIREAYEDNWKFKVINTAEEKEDIDKLSELLIRNPIIIQAIRQQ